MFAALKGLDDDHPSAATGAWVREYLWLIVVSGIICFGLLMPCHNTEQLTHFHQVPGSPGIGEQAVVTDTVEAVRQDMDEKTANKLTRFQGHGLLSGLSFSPIILPFEGDARGVEPDQTAVGDGDAVCVTAEIGEDRFRPTEWRLGVNHPLGLV